MGENKVGDEKNNEEPHKYGEPKKYDPTFNGPIKKRGCTDIICTILFFVCFVGTVVVAWWAYTKGNPALLLHPTDSSGNLCGYDTYLDKPNLFFFDLIDCAKVGPAILTTGCPTEQVCVAECPSAYWSWYIQLAAEKAFETAPIGTLASSSVFTTGRAKMKGFCKYGVDPTDGALYGSSSKLVELIENGECAGYYYPQEAVVGRCLPAFLTSLADGIKDVAGAVNNANVSEVIRDSNNKTVTVADLTDGQYWISKLVQARNYAEKFFQDAESSKWFLLGGLILAMIVSFFWIVIMRWIAGIMVWVTLLAFLGLFAFASVYSYLEYYDLKAAKGNTTEEWKWTLDYTYYLGLSKVWLAFGCSTATITIILILVVLFLRERILIAIALLKEGSRAIGCMLFTLIWPIWPFVLQAGLIAYWGLACIYLASISRAAYGSTNSTLLDSNETISRSISTTAAPADAAFKESISCNADGNDTLGTICTFVNNEVEAYTIYLQVFMLFMFLWILNWIIGFGQMVLAGSFASYYWAFDKDEHIPTFPVLGSIGRTLFYHTGTIAFGAFIIAIIQMIRIGLEYLDSKLKGAENRIAKFLLKCLKCCFYCLEKFMKMINKNAYIMTAIYGKNFCTAAKDAFFLIMRNIIRVAVVDKVTDFILFVGKLVVVGTLVGLSFYFFAPNEQAAKPAWLLTYQPSLNYYFIPIIIISIGGFVIASCFFSVYAMAVDTLFLCFLEDLERNDGSAEKPYYMSKELKDILGKKNVNKSNED